MLIAVKLVQSPGDTAAVLIGLFMVCSRAVCLPHTSARMPKIKLLSCKMFSCVFIVDYSIVLLWYLNLINLWHFLVFKI